MPTEFPVTTRVLMMSHFREKGLLCALALLQKLDTARKTIVRHLGSRQLRKYYLRACKGAVPLKHHWRMLRVVAGEISAPAKARSH